MHTSEVLNKAADLIEERGWTTGPTGWITVDDGPLCLEGGISAALGIMGHLPKRETFARCPAYRAVQEYVGYQGSLWEWNDETTEALDSARIAEDKARIIRQIDEIAALAFENDNLTVAITYGKLPDLLGPIAETRDGNNEPTPLGDAAFYAAYGEAS